MFHLAPLQPADVPAFCALARRAYPPAYAHFWTDGGAWYAEKCFNERQILSEMADPAASFFFVKRADERIGFVKFNSQKALPSSGLPAQKCAELERIYFLSEAAGKGAGRFAVAAFFEKCRAEKAQIGWLRVMEQSLGARAFYEKMGFRNIATAALDFDLLRPEMREILTYRIDF